jgi:hypothetical protein
MLDVYGLVNYVEDAALQGKLIERGGLGTVYPLIRVTCFVKIMLSVSKTAYLN